MKNQNKQKRSVGQIIVSAAVILMCVGIGGISGYFMASTVEAVEGDFILWLALNLLFFYFAVLIQYAIHEAGHLIFGVMTGYRLVSYRILNFMWIRQNGKIHFRRISVPGTAGQCLMEPPELQNEKYPTVLYNLGGSLLNLIIAILFGGIAFILSGSFIGIFVTQLNVNTKMSEGARLKDMPEEWFVVPSDEAMKNVLTATVGVFVCNRLMDEHKFSEADQLMTYLLDIDSGILGLYRKSMVIDQIYCEVLGENRQERLDWLLNKPQKKFMKKSKSNISVLRTEYAYALCVEKNKQKAEKIKKNFTKWIKSYPYQGEITYEIELLALAEQKAMTKS